MWGHADMDDLLKEFLAETREALDVLDSELVELEQRPGDPALLGSIFRIMHTIKGTCGFLGLPRLETVAHAAEDVLGRVRDGGLEVSPEVVSLVLAALDRIKELVADLGASGSEPAGSDDELTSALRVLASGETPPVASDAPAVRPETLYERFTALRIDTFARRLCRLPEKVAQGDALAPDMLGDCSSHWRAASSPCRRRPASTLRMLTCLADNGGPKATSVLRGEIGKAFASGRQRRRCDGAACPPEESRSYAALASAGAGAHYRNRAASRKTRCLPGRPKHCGSTSTFSKT